MTVQVRQNDDPFGVFSFADTSRELQVAEDTEDGEEEKRRAKLTVLRRQGTYHSVEVGVVGLLLNLESYRLFSPLDQHVFSRPDSPPPHLISAQPCTFFTSSNHCPAALPRELFTSTLHFDMVFARVPLSRPQTINLYDGFVCHDTVVVVAVTSN